MVELGNISVEGKEKTFSIINTANYDSDAIGVIVVNVDSEEELTNYGFDSDEIEIIKTLTIGETCTSLDYGNGVVVVRMA